MDADNFLKQYALGERDFQGAYLFNLSLIGRDLRGANFTYAFLSRTNLSGADLRGANLRGANLYSATLRGVDLRGAFLYEADLSKAHLEGAKLCGAFLSSVNFGSAILSGADFKGAILTISNLNGACLKGADLTAASIQSSDFTNADLTGANLQGVDLTEVKLDQAILSATEMDKIPDSVSESSKSLPDAANAVSESNDSASNQGVLFNPDWQIQTWEGMRFRSKAEVKIAQALDQALVFFLPNCLTRLNNPQKRGGRGNLEPDFLVCYYGKWGILEVDGPFHTPDRRVKEQERERLFKMHGIRVVERFDAARCETQPDEVVKQFLSILEVLH
jgi:uncharacterized protein YjbI with pentapeptide repeats